VAARAESRVLTRVPLEWIETTSGKVQLLLDIGTGMEPYWLDVERLPEELSRVAGPDGLTLRWFEDCPFEADVLTPGNDEPVPYGLPAVGTRIVAVTGFGSRGAAGPPARVVRRWLRYAAACRRAGVPLVALTPLPGRRLSGLARRVPLVTWDRPTGVRDVRRAVRAARVQ